MSWTKRIKKALKVGVFTQEDKDDASSWTTCAVGEVSQRYPKVVVVVDEAYDHEPKNGRMEQLGADFYDAVAEDRVRDAAKIFVKIQAHTLKLALGV